MGKVTKNIEKHKTKPNKTRKNTCFIRFLFYFLRYTLHFMMTLWLFPLSVRMMKTPLRPSVERVCWRISLPSVE